MGGSLANECADCGAAAEIYDNRVPLCLLCSDVRDAKKLLRDDALLQRVENARKAYRLSLEVLKTSRGLSGDIRGHSDGIVSLKQAQDQFAQAQAEYQEAKNAFVMRAREVAKQTGKPSRWL